MPAQTLILADFLLARIAEDEANGWVSSGLRAAEYVNTRAHLECEAKRRIVGIHALYEFDYVDSEGDDRHVLACACCEGSDYPCPTLRAVASIYADHPDYRKEWKP